MSKRKSIRDVAAGYSLMERQLATREKREEDKV